ncbi:MAG TPA: DMT family transporter [Solirubrobacteraceae bacterium]|nr:DMT family transporter [Solirubrobacteraceae bacterium]
MTPTLLATAHHAHGLTYALGFPGRFLRRLDTRLDRAYIPAVVILESVMGAAFYALSSVLEQQAAREEPDNESLRASLLVALVQRRRWLLGMAAGVAGFAMQFIALRKGSLALVTPIFVTSLVMALLGSALAQHRRLSRGEWLANAEILAGVALFIAIAQPGPGHPRGPTIGWILLAVTSTTAVAALVALSHGSPQRRSLALGAATGIVFGATAAVTERTSHRLGISLGYGLSDWSPYVLIVVSIFGLLLNQSAFQAGDLKWSLPAITVLEPIVAILIGQTLFHEHIATGALRVTGETLGLVLIVVGVLALARSPALPGHAPVRGGPDAPAG